MNSIFEITTATAKLKKILIVLFHAFVLWALCGATIGIGRSVTTMRVALIIHAIGAPIFAGLVSFVYYRYFNYTTPKQTAAIFLLLIVIMDAGLVAPFIEKSFAMFRSLLGTWIPFILIFVSTYFTGIVLRRNQ